MLLVHNLGRTTGVAAAKLLSNAAINFLQAGKLTGESTYALLVVQLVQGYW